MRSRRRRVLCNASASQSMVEVMGEAEIYETVRPGLVRYAVALVGVHDAEDVVGTVVARVLARPGGLAGLREPKPYLTRAVLNEVRARHRANLRAVPVIGSDDGLWAMDATAAGDRASGDLVDVAVSVVSGLPPRQRAAAYLVFFEEYTPTEAAHLMGCRPGTVRRYLHLARAALKEALNG